MGFATVEEALEDLRNGKIIVVTDDPDRENEGDTICAAEFATTENVNFMATYAKGLICMPMSSSYVKKLGLSPMVAENTDNHCTAFTASIDHISTTTGISAQERSITAMKTVLDNAQPSDFRRPGHMFPLEAKSGGVFERDGHTEATVDLMKLAGLKEVGLCCEIMADDGTMMRKTQLLEFAEKHNLKFITIKDIQQYRRKKEELKCAVSANLPTKYGKFTIYGYEKADGEHHIALVKGNVKDKENVLVRVHSECLTGDVFGSSKCDCGDQYAAAMEKISQEDCGILVYLRQEGRGIGLINKLRAYALQDKGMDTVEANLALGFDADMRDYGCAAIILKDLGVKSIRLITNNPEKIHGLEKYNIKINERVSLPTPRKAECVHYMETKKNKMGHIIL